MGELITGYVAVALVVACCLIYALTGWPWRFPYADADRAARLTTGMIGVLIAVAVVLAFR